MLPLLLMLLQLLVLAVCGSRLLPDVPCCVVAAAAATASG
jgi:hypothetical protein